MKKCYTCNKELGHFYVTFNFYVDNKESAFDRKYFCDGLCMQNWINVWMDDKV